MARIAALEIMVDGGGVAGGLSGVAYVLQTDRPEHHLARIVNGDTACPELAQIGCELFGCHPTQGGTDGLLGDFVGGRSGGVGSLIGPVNEDPVPEDVIAIDRWKPCIGRRVREHGPGRVEDRQAAPKL